jgi:hypothetical protein
MTLAASTTFLTIRVGEIVAKIQNDVTTVVTRGAGAQRKQAGDAQELAAGAGNGPRRDQVLMTDSHASSTPLPPLPAFEQARTRWRHSHGWPYRRTPAESGSRSLSA